MALPPQALGELAPPCTPGRPPPPRTQTRRLRQGLQPEGPWWQPHAQAVPPPPLPPGGASAVTCRCAVPARRSSTSPASRAHARHTHPTRTNPLGRLTSTVTVATLDFTAGCAGGLTVTWYWKLVGPAKLQRGPQGRQRAASATRGGCGRLAHRMAGHLPHAARRAAATPGGCRRPAPINPRRQLLPRS